MESICIGCFYFTEVVIPPQKRKQITSAQTNPAYTNYSASTREGEHRDPLVSGVDAKTMVRAPAPPHTALRLKGIPG